VSTILRGEKLLREMQRLIGINAAQGKPLGVLMLGVHGLRKYVVQHGLASGEVLMERILDLVGAALRPGDLVLRIGSADLLVILPEIRDTGHAMLAATRLLRQFENTIEVAGLPALVQVSIGVATSPEHGRTGDALYRHAEASLMLARESADRMAVAPPRTFDVEIEPADLREALHGDQLSIHFQPFLDVASNRLHGVEALARWRHPERGPISPDLFVPMAESTGMIGELTRWSINAILQHATRARDAGLHLPVSINLSAGAFAERGVVEHVVGALSLWNVDPADVVIEVTETAIISDLDRGAKMVGKLAAAGIGISIDDFGVGNSSFAYLRDFPATELKIDKSFIKPMTTDDRSSKLVKAMIDFSHNMGVRVVAEGVEDAETLALLRDLGCDFAQGWEIGRPEPAADYVEKRLRERA
jgi:diguanylate cyclase (GGDEF)-like protein